MYDNPFGGKGRKTMARPMGTPAMARPQAGAMPSQADPRAMQAMQRLRQMPAPQPGAMGRGMPSVGGRRPAPDGGMMRPAVMPRGWRTR